MASFAVGGIPDERMKDMVEMLAYLPRSPCHWLDLNQRIAGGIVATNRYR